ncbi:hypothetical protein SO802_021670 [Lithocarpus litseifolius]|uniref:Bacterial sugar transferase domain-containing protein n=1 Tax=Lithocarpus litseifolius TaxID=425828 RepID=A0AAW2CFG5_9ROSI
MLRKGTTFNSKLVILAVAGGVVYLWFTPQGLLGPAFVRFRVIKKGYIDAGSTMYTKFAPSNRVFTRPELALGTRISSNSDTSLMQHRADLAGQGRGKSDCPNLCGRAGLGQYNFPAGWGWGTHDLALSRRHPI